MVTYADMLTLLLVLFIVLYAISSLNTDKFAELKASLSNAFGNGQSPVLNGGTGPVDGSSMTQQAQNLSANSINKMPPASSRRSAPADQTAVQKEIDEFNKIKAAIKASLHERHLDGTAAFSIDQRGLVVTLVTDELVFAGNSAVLEPEGGVILSAVAPALVHIDNELQVDGHTNQQNVSTAPYPSGWELSSARASAVVRFLISTGTSQPSGCPRSASATSGRCCRPVTRDRSPATGGSTSWSVEAVGCPQRDALVSLGSAAVNSSGG